VSLPDVLNPSNEQQAAELRLRQQQAVELRLQMAAGAARAAEERAEPADHEAAAADARALMTSLLESRLLLTSNAPIASVVALIEMEVARGRWTRSRTAGEWAQWAQWEQEHVRAARLFLYGAEPADTDPEPGSSMAHGGDSSDGSDDDGSWR
jgi:hypothetical protein